MFASLRQMFFNENTTPDIEPHNAPDRIAILYCPYSNDSVIGFVATRRELAAVCQSSLNDTVQKMYQAAPDVKVVYIFSAIYNLNQIDNITSALTEVGYANIKVVNTHSWYFTDMFYQYGTRLEIGECIAIVDQFPTSILPKSYEVFEKTTKGYKRIGNENSCDGLYFRFSPMLKYIFIENGGHLELQLLIKSKYSHQVVFFRKATTQYDAWLSRMWDEYDGKIQTFLPALEELKIEFKYGNIFHIETVIYSQLPFKKVFELDIEDACKLEVKKFRHLGLCEELKPGFLFSIGKSRVLKIVLKVGLEFCPQIDVTVASETDTIRSVVYIIDYEHESKLFTGTLMTSESAFLVVERSNNISDVFKKLDVKKGLAKLRGVFVDYPGHDSFPLDTHRAVINALPSPKTKVCVGGIHTEWAIHLRNANAKIQVDEYVVIADVEGEYPAPTDYLSIHEGPKNMCFLKTKDGFKIYDEFEHKFPDPLLTTRVYIMEKKEPDFGSQKVLVSETSKLTKNISNLFAWEYFNGKNFDDYMVEPYRGISFVAKIGSKQYNIYRRCDSHYGSSECYITCAIKHSDSDSKFTVNMKCVGYLKKCIVLEIPMPKSDYVLLHICVDEHLVPTVTVTETNTPLLPEGLATGDESILKQIKRVLKKKDFVSYSSLTQIIPSNVEKAELTENHEDNELKKVSKGLSETTDLPEAILTESATDSNEAASEPTASDCISTASDMSNDTLYTVVLTFTHCNRVLISAGPEYTGEDEFPAYLRLRHKNKRYQFVVGQKAKTALMTHRESVIYDVPGLLAANLNPKCENAAWNFKTSRADDDSLLVHLNTKDKASPVVVFGHIVLAMLQHVNENLPKKVERIGIRFPSEVSISEKDLYAISSKLGVELKLV